jgi:hypothetical protein
VLRGRPGRLGMGGRVFSTGDEQVTFGRMADVPRSGSVRRGAD